MSKHLDPYANDAALIAACYIKESSLTDFAYLWERPLAEDTNRAMSWKVAKLFIRLFNQHAKELNLTREEAKAIKRAFFGINRLERLSKLKYPNNAAARVGSADSYYNRQFNPRRKLNEMNDCSTYLSAADQANYTLAYINETQRKAFN